VAVCVTSPTSSGVSAIVGFRPAATRGRAIRDQPDLPTLLRGRAHRPQASGLAARPWGLGPRSWSRQGSAHWSPDFVHVPTDGASASSTCAHNRVYDGRRRRADGQRRSSRCPSGIGPLEVPGGGYTAAQETVPSCTSRRSNTHIPTGLSLTARVHCITSTD
jgi:diadenosine tetraphosphatase ApaH/serine/threonine PP2A family protein phosphatase